MSAARIRILAWATALSLAAIVVIRGNRPGAAVREHDSAVASATQTQPPRLLRIDGPLEEIASPQNLKVRDPQLRTVNVIRERGAPSPDQVGEPELAPSYSLPEPRGPRFKMHPKVPLELMLAEPRREESPIAPRASQEIQIEPELESTLPSPLPILSMADPAMQPVNDAASRHVQRGFSLGERAAIYAARTEFIQALRTIAQAVDAQAGLAPKDRQSCSQALVRGLQALTEADDLAPSGSRLDGELDLAAIIAAHRTPACKRDKPSSQLAALQAYFDYSREQLTRAAAANPVGSQALAGLGKTYQAGGDKNPHRLAGAKAMVFHQAAVATDANSHFAANELGVLLARYGQWEQAKQSLLQSLRVQSDAAAWQNLAAVHARLGETELAQLAQQERELLLRERAPNVHSGVDGSPTVQWVDPKAFAGPPEEAQPMPMPAPATGKPKSATATAGKSDPWSWLPWR